MTRKSLRRKALFAAMAGAFFVTGMSQKAEAAETEEASLAAEMTSDEDQQEAGPTADGRNAGETEGDKAEDTEKNITETETAESEETDAADKDAADKDAADKDAPDKDAPDKDATDTDAADTDAADTDAADTDAADTDAADTDAADTDAADTDAADTDAADTETAETETADSDTADTEAVVYEDTVTDDTVTDSTETTESEETEAEEAEETETEAEETEETEQGFVIPRYVTTEDSNNGWVKDGYYYYYYIDGEKVTNTVMEIDGTLYAFAGNGRRIEDSSFSLYIGSKTFSGRAKLDGSLYRSEWYSYDEEDLVTGRKTTVWYYYCSDGSAASGIQKVKSKEYLFYGGELLISGAAKINGKIYAGTKQGYPVELTKSGWNEVDGCWFYILNGNIVRSTLLSISGKTYGFGFYGKMAVDESIYVNYQSRNGMALALEDGTIAFNTWKTLPDGKWAYFDAMGMSASGHIKIGKQDYIFYEYSSVGYMLVSGAYTISSGEVPGVYYADSEGHARLLKEGWNQLDGKYCYVEDGLMLKECIRKIDGKYYGFGEDGFMFDNEAFNIYSSGKYYYCRAKKGGVLYQNEWYQTDKGEWYYFGEDCQVYTGIRTIGNKTYKFNTSYYVSESIPGKMITNTVDTLEGQYFVFNSQGEGIPAPENGWMDVDGEWYYAVDGELVKNKVLSITDRYYGFGSTYRMYKNIRFRNNSYYYRADASGVLLTNKWNGNEYYGSDAKAYEDGIYEIKGKKFFFRNGLAVTREYVSDDDGMYYAGENGVLSEISKSGIYYTYDSYSRPILHSVKNGKLETDTWKQVNGKWYYLDEYGDACRGYWNEIDGHFYYFNIDGSLMTGGWNYTQSGIIYVLKDGYAATGHQKIGNVWYYFDYFGEMQTGAVYTEGKYCMYGSNGAYMGVMKQGWNKLNGNWYYLKENGNLANGKTVIEGKNYWFDSYIMKSSYVDEDNDIIYGSDGAQVMSGWCQIDGDWYYVNPGTNEYVESDQTIDGKNYYFGYFGKLLTEDFVSAGKYYKIGKDGSITESGYLPVGWTLFDGAWYYMPADGDYYYDGWVEDSYVNSGSLYTCGTYRITGDGYLIDENGKYVSKKGWVYGITDRYRWSDKNIDNHTWYYVLPNGKVFEEGWKKIDGDWYYFSDYELVTTSFMSGKDYYVINNKNGKLEKTISNISDGWHEINGSWIYISMGGIVANEFIDDGRIYNTYNSYTTYNSTGEPYGSAYKNCVPSIDWFYFYSSANGLYYFGADGSAVTTYRGWNKLNGKWYYFGDQGIIYDGWFQVDGKTYYNDGGNGIVTGYRNIDDMLYQFDGNGALVRGIYKDEGWAKYGGDWYYFEGGRLSTKDRVVEDKKTFVLDGDGKMVRSGMSGSVYADANGVLVKNTWKTVDGYTYYFGSDGYCVTGYYKIGGKTYHFDYAGRLMK